MSEGPTRSGRALAPKSPSFLEIFRLSYCTAYTSSHSRVQTSQLDKLKQVDCEQASVHTALDMPLSDLATLFLGERDDNPEVQAKRRRAITHALGGLVSYSVTFKGTPEAIKAKLAEESARLTDQSKQEFDAVKPALEILLDSHQGDGLVLLEANGHANFTGEIRTYSTGNASVKGNQQA